MSGGGSIAAMVASIKGNRALLKKNKRFFKQHPKAGDIDFSKHIDHKLHYEKASEKQLQKIRDEIGEEQRRIAVKRLVILLISLIITAFIVFYVYDFMISLNNNIDLQ